MPRNLVIAAESQGRGRWLAVLPAALQDISERWSLRLGEPFQPGGHTAWVGPVSADLVLKVAWRHPEALHESYGLREWAGDGSVRLHAAEDYDDETAVLLLERCVPGTELSARPETEQDVVISGLLRRLWREPAAGHSFRSLQSMCDSWADEYEGKPGHVDAGMAREGLALFRALPATADRAALLCTDLHAGNVLAAEREPWLVIDPKPYVGDPTYDALQHMLNCDERLRTNPRGLTYRMADLLGLDPERLLRWLFARCVVESPDWPWLAEVARQL